MNPRDPKRRRPRDRQASGTAVRIDVRRHRALTLALEGRPYRAIAQLCGVSIQTAYNDVQVELGYLDKAKEAMAERLRDLELAKMDALWLKLWPSGRRTPTPAVATQLIRISERRAKLLGLDQDPGLLLSGPPPPLEIVVRRYDEEAPPPAP